ncbi:MAG: DNA mismatch repair endonuclease MutL [Hyphomicrobiales bacterium]|nr:DNA mismatch repair endonuclease MutL [Hyphomicrobiales bacterium]
MPAIRQLSNDVVTRIAAGEVVERPANVVKELLENALDAGASQIEIHIQRGGMQRIDVTDNGSGIAKEELALAVSRHATSKLDERQARADGVFAVETLGFRGEALAAIGSVAKMQLISRLPRAENGSDSHKSAYGLAVSGGKTSPVRAAAGEPGTRVVVEDLFFATPARLKFLKSERAESLAIADVVRRFALAHPQLGLVWMEDGKRRLNLPPHGGEMADGLTDGLAAHDGLAARAEAVLGNRFVSNSVAVNLCDEDAGQEMRLAGYAGLPTFHHANSHWQYFFVNARPVRDKLFYGALRAAYHDYLVAGRHPAVLLHLFVPPHEVDVNVHPTKAEVRFRAAARVRSLVIGGLRQALHAAGHRATDRNAHAALRAMQPRQFPAASASYGGSYGASHGGAGPLEAREAQHELGDAKSEEGARAGLVSPPPSEADAARLPDLPLGLARAQLHATYIVAQTADGLVIVDQHAAHERLVYEQMKAALERDGIARQMLLVPEVVELGAGEAALLLEKTEELAALGLVIEAFSGDAVLVRETPAMLGELDVAALVRDLAAELATSGQGLALKENLDAWCGTLACHTSIRAGKRLEGAEMDALLRQMEQTPHAGQCNHGRPTYVELKLADIERLFGRR